MTEAYVPSKNPQLESKNLNPREGYLWVLKFVWFQNNNLEISSLFSSKCHLLTGSVCECQKFKDIESTENNFADEFQVFLTLSHIIKSVGRVVEDKIGTQTLNA